MKASSCFTLRWSAASSVRDWMSCCLKVSGAAKFSSTQRGYTTLVGSLPRSTAIVQSVYFENVTDSTGIDRGLQYISHSLCRLFQAMHITWKSYSCPSCGTDLAIRFGSPTKIGVEYNHCPCCGSAYRTPDKEWANMTISERVGHFVAPWTAGVITMAGIIGFTAGLLAGKSRFIGIIKGLGIVSALLIPYWLVKLFVVIESLRRCPAHKRKSFG